MKKKIIIVLGAVLVLSGCGKDSKRYEPPKEPFDRSAVLATQGDLTLNIGELINGFSQYGRFETLAQRAITHNETSYVIQVVERAVEARREADRARELGYESDPQYKQFIRRLEFEKRVQSFITREVLREAHVSDETIRKYYEQNKDTLFSSPRRIKFKWIFVKKDKWGSWENAKTRAELIEQKLRGKSAFGDLIYTYSDSEEKDRLKDKGWFVREDLDLNPALQEAAFNLREVGEWTGPVKSGNGYHFVMLTGDKPKKAMEFEAVKETIRKRKLVEQIEKRLDKIVKEEGKRAKIEKHLEVLNDLNAPDEEPVFSVDGYDYTLGMLRQLIQEKGAETSDEVDKQIERQIRNAILYTIALKKGYGGIDVGTVYQGVIDDYLRNLYLEREIRGKMEIPESRILEEYTRNKGVYVYPARIHPYWIFIAARVAPDARVVEKELAMIEAEKTAQKIYYNLILETGESFRYLASQFSDDLETKSRGGDLGIYGGGPQGHLFDQTAFGLEEGEISQPVRLKNGYALIWVEEKMPRRPMSYEEALSKVREKCVDGDFQEAKDALAKELQADVEVDESNLRVISDYLLKAIDDSLLQAYMVR